MSIHHRITWNLWHWHLSKVVSNKRNKLCPQFKKDKAVENRIIKVKTATKILHKPNFKWPKLKRKKLLKVHPDLPGSSAIMRTNLKKIPGNIPINYEIQKFIHKSILSYTIKIQFLSKKEIEEIKTRLQGIQKIVIRKLNKEISLRMKIDNFNKTIMLINHDN